MRTILPFERVGRRRARVLQDPLAHLPGQVEAGPVALEQVDRAAGLLVVAKPAAVALGEDPVERVLACVPERRVAHVVAEPDRLGQILVQPQRAGDDAGDGGRLERVRHPCADVVAGRVDEDLGLPFQAPKRLRVRDAVAVALERSAQPALLFGRLAATRLVRRNGQRRQ